jgi:hypothetical protein
MKQASPDASHQPATTNDCCPPLSNHRCCDVLDLRYRLLHPVQIGQRTGRAVTVAVEVILHIRVTRCPGPYSLGDPIHTITLLPGEKVKLITADRRTRFTLDSSTNVSYRNEQLSEEKYFMAAMQSSMSDLSVTDAQASASSETENFDLQGSAGSSLGFFSVSADTSAGGSHSGASTADFLRQLSSHANASASQAALVTQAAASISIGEVATRSHTTTQSEDHYESSSREFSNANRCHAVTYFFYRMNKKQIVKITLEGIERRVEDPASPTKVSYNPPPSKGQISVIPNSVLATEKDRVAVEQIGRDSVAARADTERQTSAARLAAATIRPPAEPLSDAIRKAAIDAVDKNLVAAGLLTTIGGVVLPQAQIDFEISSESCLPTPGIIVKGCLDDCDVCEPELQRKIELELEEQQLKNQLLQRQIDLLDRSQEYRDNPAPVPQTQP